MSKARSRGRRNDSIRVSASIPQLRLYATKNGALRGSIEVSEVGIIRRFEVVVPARNITPEARDFVTNHDGPVMIEEADLGLPQELGDQVHIDGSSVVLPLGEREFEGRVRPVIAFLRWARCLVGDGFRTEFVRFSVPANASDVETSSSREEDNS
jgi:hypothetical protein